MLSQIQNLNLIHSYVEEFHSRNSELQKTIIDATSEGYLPKEVAHDALHAIIEAWITPRSSGLSGRELNKLNCLCEDRVISLERYILGTNSGTPEVVLDFDKVKKLGLVEDIKTLLLLK